MRNCKYLFRSVFSDPKAPKIVHIAKPKHDTVNSMHSDARVQVFLL